MKKKILAIIFTLVFFSLTINLNVFYAENINDIINNEHLTKENFLNLSSDKLVEDFEYFFKTMKENSPFFNATKRHIPDLKKQFEEYKKKIFESKSNLEQLYLIDEFANKFLGHNGMILNIDDTIKSYDSLSNRKTWAKVLSGDPLTQRNNDLYIHFMCNEIIKMLPQHSITNTLNENVETKIIEPNKIAYIKVKSFSACHVGPHDGKIINDFFEKSKDYDNIIIDITGNGGGTTEYINIFAPIFKHSFEFESYSLLKIGNNSKEYIDEVYSYVKPIDELPNFPNLNLEDKKELTHFVKLFAPVNAAKNPIKGKVWLLIDNKVFSTAELFAILCKSCGEVTLVGKNTLGDGIGTDPIYMVLPNSKVALRYCIDYGLNDDGSCNAECGTKPDIISLDGEDSLTTCLKAIKSQQN